MMDAQIWRADVTWREAASYGGVSPVLGVGEARRSRVGHRVGARYSTGTIISTIPRRNPEWILN